jgi:vacuolar-type H+-ATPase subunit E/Vma4
MENLKSHLKFLQAMEAKEIIEEAEEKARKIISEAEEKAMKIRNEKMAELSEILLEKNSELATTRLNGRNRILNIKFQLFEEALAKSVEHLKLTVVNDRKRYEKSLEKLIIEAATSLNGTLFEILINSQDKKFVAKKLRELQFEISTLKGEEVILRIDEETLNTFGGATVRTVDKRRIFNNTLEARITAVKNEAGSNVFDILFEGAGN